MLKDFIKKLNSTEIDTDAIARKLAKLTFKSNKLAFYDTLANMIENDLSVQRALEHIIATETDMGAKKGSSDLYYVSRDCLDAVNRGGKVSAALESWVSFNETQVILSGELTGNMASSLRQVIKNVTAVRDMLWSILSISFYPLALITVSVINIYMMYTELFPRLTSFAPRERWTQWMEMLYQISYVIIEYGLVLSGAVVGVFILIGFSMQRYNGRFRRYLDKVPPWSIYQTFQGVSFLFNIASMLQIDIPFKESLYKLESNAVRNKWLHERIKEIRRYVLLGQPFPQALKNSGYEFPSRSCINQLLLQSKTADSSLVMAKFAENWLLNAVKSVKKNGVWITIIAGGFTLFIILLMIATIYGINDVFQY